MKQRPPYLGGMSTRINMELPPEVARRFVEDMEAFFRETNPIKRDEIALRQLHAPAASQAERAQT